MKTNVVTYVIVCLLVCVCTCVCVYGVCVCVHVCYSVCGVCVHVCGGDTLIRKKNLAYHDSDHDGKTVLNLIGRLDQDDRQTDSHPDHTP